MQGKNIIKIIHGQKKDKETKKISRLYNIFIRKEERKEKKKVHVNVLRSSAMLDISKNEEAHDVKDTECDVSYLSTTMAL